MREWWRKLRCKWGKHDVPSILQVYQAGKLNMIDSPGSGVYQTCTTCGRAFLYYYYRSAAWERADQWEAAYARACLSAREAGLAAPERPSHPELVWMAYSKRDSWAEICKPIDIS